MAPLRLIRAHVLDGLRALRDESVHCVVTSPPYYGLRDYGLPPVAWGDGWSGCLGLEPTPEQYVEHLVEVFDEVRRVLRPDGTLWVNMGDSYASGGGTGEQGSRGQRFGRRHTQEWTGINRSFPELGLKPKDLLGMPWRLAFALQADGWWLRKDIIWHKPNPMPESVKDRPATAHEYLYLLSKSARYFYDAEAVRETDSGLPAGNGFSGRQGGERSTVVSGGVGTEDRWLPGGGRNLRSVWTIPTQPFPEAHFATFPPALVEPCLKAGTSELGVCPRCGGPWEKVLVRQRTVDGEPVEDLGTWDTGNRPTMGAQGIGHWRFGSRSTVIGWRSTCGHLDRPVPATVLDPFAGAATTGVVCAQLDRRFIGLELSAEYLGIAHRRLADYDIGRAVAAQQHERAATITGPLFDPGMA